MSFEEEIEGEGRAAKRSHPGSDRVVDRVVTDFKDRRKAGEFHLWDWNMIQEDFHKAVDRARNKAGIGARRRRPTAAKRMNK
jgi:hypothetical protein